MYYIKQKEKIEPRGREGEERGAINSTTNTEIKNDPK